MDLCKKIVICILLASCSEPPVKVLGDDVYYIAFRPDWQAFKSGTYQYGLGKERGFGNTSRGEYNKFHTMNLSFKMQDGREYAESIDLSALVKKLGESQKVFDVRKTEWGGSARIIFYIKQDQLQVEYSVWEYIESPKFITKFHTYPLFEKTLS